MSPSSSNVAESVCHGDTESIPAWKQELNDRLAATRGRRRRDKEDQIALPGLEGEQGKGDSRAAQLAAKVAQRYADAPSYSDCLAAAARAKADAADRVKAEAAARVKAEAAATPPPAPQPALENSKAILSTREKSHSPGPQISNPQLEEPAYELGSATAAVEPLAVNLIERPRELVAARKARPRLAEGPLREGAHEGRDQFKIFEVAADSISQTVSIGKTPADWTPIRLETEPAGLRSVAETPAAHIPLQTASFEDRIMAGLFDLALIVAAFAAFVLVFVACTAHPPMGKPALVGAGLVMAAFGMLYQYLFFKYGDGTPGMRYAKIALCTFDDENPTRRAMCRRVLYLALSAAPLGLGFAWAWFDPDHLAWHDRVSRIYQRSYL
ncbi:MAG: RDD family protein [Acidobacteriaceae bacterium]